MTSTRCWTPRRAGRRRTGTTGCGTGGATPSSSSASCSASRTRPSSSRTASAGRWRQTPRRCWRTSGRAAGVIVQGGHRAAAAAGALPGAGNPRGSGPLPAAVVERAARRADRRPTCWCWRARGIARTAREPVVVNHAIRDFADRFRPGPGSAAPVDQAAGPAPPRAVPVVSDRARARAAGPGHRRRAAQAAPRPAGGLAGPAPGDRAAGQAGRAHSPGLGVPGQRITAPGRRMRRT